MDDWKVSLDRYLTQSPYDNGFDSYYDAVLEAFTETFYQENEDWVMKDGNQINKWIVRLCDKDKSPEKAAKIIERAFEFYGEQDDR